MSIWQLILNWLRRDRVAPVAPTLDGKATMALGTIRIPLNHNGRDVAGAVEAFGASFGKLYMNPGKVAVPAAAFSALTGAAPNIKSVVTASVDFTAGTNTFEVTFTDAAGNEGPSLGVTTIQVVDNKAPAAPTLDGAATFSPN